MAAEWLAVAPPPGCRCDARDQNFNNITQLPLVRVLKTQQATRSTRRGSMRHHCALKHGIVKEFLAEFLGTFVLVVSRFLYFEFFSCCVWLQKSLSALILVTILWWLLLVVSIEACVLCCQLFGCGSVAQTVLSRNTLGEPLTVHIGFSVGLMMAAYVAGGVSGNISQKGEKFILYFSCFIIRLWCQKGPIEFLQIITFSRKQKCSILGGGFKQRAKCSLYCSATLCFVCVLSPSIGGPGWKKY